MSAIAVRDLCLVSCSWIGIGKLSLIDLDRSLTQCNKSLRTLLEVLLYTAGLDVCLLSANVTSFATVCITCVSKSDADSLVDKYRSSGLLVGSLGKLHPQQVYVSNHKPAAAAKPQQPQQPQLRQVPAPPDKYALFICWDLDQCALSFNDDVHDIHRRVVHTAAEYAGVSATSLEVVSKIAFSQHAAVSLSPRHNRELSSDLRYKMLLQASAAAIYKELELMAKMCAERKAAKPLVLLLAGMTWHYHTY
jgi:hypothetical protein